MKRLRAWQTHRREELFKHRVLELERHELRARDGGERQALVLRTPDWVNVVALLEEAGREPELLLVRQWRFGIARETLEIPGGMVDPGESDEEAARRELVEETGYRAHRWRRLGEVWPNPAIMTNRCSTWLAQDLERLGEPQGDGDEELEVERVPLADARRLVAEGTIGHSLVIAAFYLHDLDGGAGVE